MTKSEIFALMLKCNGPQLSAIVQVLDLNQAFLPAPDQAVATRASSIMELVVQRQLLPDLERALIEFFPAPTPRPQPPRNEATRIKRVLILAANPIETDRLMLDEEVRLIKQRLGESDAGREYRIESEWAVRATELSKFLLDYQPVLVHFSGHGSPTGDLILQADDGRAAPVAVSVLANLFGILKGPTECVVLNACYSLAQAEALASQVGCVVGMCKAIGDPSALRFAAGFYRALAFGRDYHTAFRLGSNEIELAALPDVAVPHFTTRGEDQVAQVRTEGKGVVVAMGTPTRTWVPPGTRSIAAEDSDTPRLYPVWFGTNRRPVDAQDLTKGFSAQRDDAVHHGVCQVAVPKSHKFGSVGSSWWKRLLTLTDDRMTLKEISALQEEAFWASARQALSTWDVGERMALVFIHGFNVSFEEAAIRAAQMGVDLKITGLTAFYSWPSQGKLGLRDYTADEASVEASEAQIAGFLTGFAQRTDARRVQVIAHSMGNRGLLRAMQRIVQTASQASQKPFHHLIFAAPDVDAGVFLQLAQAHRTLAAKATLYVSSHDRAVASSGLLHKAPRAGFTPPVMLVPGMDTIDVSNVDLTLLGHGYYGAADGVLYDMHELLSHDTAPGSRLKLKPPPDGGAYWSID